MNKLWLAVVVCLLLAGCAIQPIDPGKPVTVGDITVNNPQLKWARITTAATSGTVWTVDGLGLDELRFYPDIASGHPLLSSRDDGVPVYSSTMLPDDVVELFASSLGRAGFRQVHTSDVKPTLLGTVPALTFHLAFTNPDGLEMEGLALAAQRGGSLDAMLFIAPREYYFDRYAATVKALFSSTEFKN
jgi:hypothetical protein